MSFTIHEVRDMVEAGRRIDAIKALRSGDHFLDGRGLDLKMAKDLVELLARQVVVSPAPQDYALYKRQQEVQAETIRDLRAKLEEYEDRLARQAQEAEVRYMNLQLRVVQAISD